MCQFNECAQPPCQCFPFQTSEKGGHPRLFYQARGSKFQILTQFTTEFAQKYSSVCASESPQCERADIGIAGMVLSIRNQ